MTSRAHGWRLGLIAIASMLMMLMAPVFVSTTGVSAQADPATQFSTAISQLPAMAPVAGPLSGSLDAANADSAPAGVSVTNGVAHADFIVPAVNPGGLWAIAMMFRVSEAGQNFLLVFPDGTWQLDNGVPGGAISGTGATFDTTPGANVSLDVVFDGATGSFGINGVFVAGLDLSAVQGAGDVQLTGYLGLGAGVPTLDYTNFTVYDFAGGTAAPTETTGGQTDVPTAAVPTTTGGTTGTPGDPESTFNELLALEMTQPMVFGPASGAMIHDPERITFEPTGVSVTDFGAHIQCTAPRSAAELWDCGLAFRDTSSTNHFRLGVVSDGSWFLSVGSGSPLQNGRGIPIPPNAGDKITLDLIVQGNTGYFGVDGVFVSDLDLTQIPGPGTVAAVVGFFDETYIPGGQTTYEDFYVSSFDSSTQTPPMPSETAVVGLPTQAPTVQVPPVESTPTPQSGAGETPVIGLPSPTPPVVETTPITQAGANSYTSPTFGYQLTWDDTWSVVTESSQDSFDVLRLSNGVVTADIYSGFSTMGLEECVTSLVSYYQGHESYTNIAIQPFPDGREIVVEGNVAVATLTFDYDAGSGAGPVPTIDTVLCVAMPTQSALVTMENYIPADQYDAQIGSVRTLESQLVVDGMPVAIPSVVTGGGQVAVPTEITGGVEPTVATSETTVSVPTVTAGSSTAFVVSPVGGGTVSGIGTIEGQARSVNLQVILVGAQPGSAVGIARGTCAELATVLDPDYFVGESSETGVVQGSAPVSITVLQSRGPYSVVVYGPGEGAPMVACGEIVAG